jgi:hypothetical protein
MLHTCFIVGLPSYVGSLFAKGMWLKIAMGTLYNKHFYVHVLALERIED